jgi:iron complex outermembrane recepter protein
MRNWLLTGASALAIASAEPAMAQTGAGAGSTQVEEIIVTAQKREESLQRTPIAISAYSEKALAARAVTDVQGLAQAAPGLSYNKVSNFVQLSIRGVSLEQINLGGEPGVALHQDGVYLARPFVGDATFADLARVEVLRGPQGTLYGRNATGGSVNLISNEPTADASGRASLTLGNYDRIRGEVLVNGALGDRMQARVSVVHDERDGYIRDLKNNRRVDDQDVWSARASLGVDLSPDVRLLLIGDYSREDDAGPIFDVGSIPGTAPALGGRVTPDKRTLFIDGPAENDIKTGGLTARLTWKMASATLTSTSAWRDSRFHLQSDLDGTDFNLISENLREDAEQWSQELQLASNGDGPLQWLVGVYGFTEKGHLDYRFPFPIAATTISFLAHQDTDVLAAYGQASYALTDRLKATVGLRYSHEEKSGQTDRVLFVASSAIMEGKWSAWTPKFGLEYQIDEARMVYASVARGFKAGGLNTGSLQTEPYDPEYVWSGEVGSKNRLADGRLQLNVSAFIYKYDDLQVNQFAVGQTFITNAASARGKGVELEFIGKPAAAVTLDGSATWLDATFDNFVTGDSFRPALGQLDLHGNRLPRAPKFTATLGAQYEASLANGGTLTLRGDYAHRSSIFFTPFNTSFAKAPSTDTLNARAAYGTPGGRWQIALFGRNLTKELTIQTITVSGINGGTIELYGPPRTFGVELRANF